MDLETFRAKIKVYRRSVGLSQEKLAGAIGLHPTVLSNKLNGTNKAYFTQREVRNLIKTLVEWEAINRRREVADLLSLAECPDFSLVEWTTSPLNRLIDSALPDQGGQAVNPNSLAVFSNQLFQPLTELVGRAEAVSKLTGILLKDNVRLLTITGVGGIGKTRLALRVATELNSRFKDGVFFLDLSAIRDPELLVGMLAESFKVGEVAGQPLQATLQYFLQEREMLVVLDNFEQIASAGLYLTGLLKSAPRLKFLVTSRVSLRVAGEHEYVVAALGVPDLGSLPSLEEVAGYPAITLFCQRAQAAQADFVLNEQNWKTIAQICASLEGLPLAIELVASYIKLLSPQTMLERLTGPASRNMRRDILTSHSQDVPPRHSSLYNSIQWSFELLKPAEQRLFVRLGVFAGGATLEAIEAICKDEESPDDQAYFFQTMVTLLDHSLLRKSQDSSGGPRLSMLQSIRDFALDRLAYATPAEEAAAVWERYANYYVALAERAEAEIFTREQKYWMDRLAEEYPNIQSILQWSKTNPERTETGLRLAGAIGRYWYLRGLVNEGQTWLETLLAQAGDSLSTPTRVKGIFALAVFAMHNIQYKKAVELFEQCLELYRQLDDRWSAAYSLNWLALLVFRQNRLEQAEDYFAESLALYEALGDNWGLGLHYSTKALTLSFRQDYDRAYEYCRKSLFYRRDTGDLYARSNTLDTLGMIASNRGNYEQARQYYSQSLGWRRELAARFGIATSLKYLVDIDLRQGQLAKVVDPLKERLQLCQELGYQAGSLECMVDFAHLATQAGMWPEAAHLLGNIRYFIEAQPDLLPASSKPVYQMLLDKVFRHFGSTGHDLLLQPFDHSVSLRQLVEYVLAFTLKLEIVPAV